MTGSQYAKAAGHVSTGTKWGICAALLQRYPKSLGADPYHGSLAMAKLWGRTFVAERDRRAGPDANAEKRGQISRQLKAELQKVLADGDD